MAIVVFLSMNPSALQTPGSRVPGFDAQLTAPGIDLAGRDAAVPRPAAPNGAGAVFCSPLRFLLRLRS